MERLKMCDLKALLDFVRRCYATQTFDDLVTTLTSGLSELIPADVTAYAEAELQTRRIRLRGSPAAFPNCQRHAGVRLPRSVRDRAATATFKNLSH
jgi:hypothetical protein